MPSDLAIDLRNVTKIYRGRIHALHGVEMHVRRGEIFGLLGPNGAGKSTLVKIMISLVHPNRAEGTVLGQPIGNKATLSRVGYLPENHRFPRYLTGRQTLEFFGALAKVDRATASRRAMELLDTVRMTDWADRKVSTYSKGMMQRIGLAQALMNDPELVLLDEPTDGVDPVGRREILDAMGHLREQGKTVFINSHVLSELESICDRVAILLKGRVAMQGRIDELTIARQRYEIEMTGNEPAILRQKVLTAVAADWKPSPPIGSVMVDRGILLGGEWVELIGPLLRIGVVDPAQVQPIIDALRSQQLVIRRVQAIRSTLEDLFLATVTSPSPGRTHMPSPAIAASGNGARR
jgi:ABC-2 type transport system ATP-binding protein